MLLVHILSRISCGLNLCASNLALKLVEHRPLYTFTTSSGWLVISVSYTIHSLVGKGYCSRLGQLHSRFSGPGNFTVCLLIFFKYVPSMKMRS